MTHVNVSAPLLPAMAWAKNLTYLPALRAECNTARAGSDKSIGLQAILNGNVAQQAWGKSLCRLNRIARSTGFFTGS